MMTSSSTSARPASIAIGVDAQAQGLIRQAAGDIDAGKTRRAVSDGYLPEPTTVRAEDEAGVSAGATDASKGTQVSRE